MRLIDADSIPFVESEDGVLFDYAYRYDINELPTIKQAKIFHSKWTHGNDGTIKCCRCRKRIKSDETRYCPNCGAKMDLKEETE